MNSNPNDSNEAKEQENTDTPLPLKKFHGIEHSKPKRRGRRGKKRKQRKNDDAECEKHCMSWGSDEEDIEIEDYNLLGDVMIRPTDVPKAPENSTQFIIDDHDECRLYKSFETPKNSEEIIEPEGEDAAYVDINYEYESPHDFDNSAYYDREFELSYKNNRYDELLRLEREELITGLRNLQEHIQELNDELIKEDPNPLLERLQAQLLEQQEKHSALKEQNSKLQKCLEEEGVNYQLLEEQFAGGKSPLSVYNQKEENSESPCHIPSMDASNKENEITFEERLSSSDSCVKAILWDSEVNETQCSPEHDLNTVTV